MTIVRICCSLFATGFVAAAASAGPVDAVNSTCPISGEAVNPKTTVEYKDATVAFCCAGCDAMFMKWDEARRDAFVASARLEGADRNGPATRPDDEGRIDQPITQPGDAKGDPYTLDVCPVSGQELGSMGDPVVKTYDGREVRFCCNSCIKRFENNKAEYFKEIDEQIVKQQRTWYPIDTCIVTGQALGSMGDPVEYVYNNRLIRFCCDSCIPRFEKDPKPFLEKLDKGVIEKQRKNYPLETCVVSGGKLGSMGEPVELVIGNRLIRLCCASCEKDIRKEPAKYLKKINEARDDREQNDN